MEEKLKTYEELEKQLQDLTPEFKDFNNYFIELTKQQKKLQSLLEYAIQLKKDQNNFETLYRKVTAKNSSNLVDALTKKGHANKKDLGDAFKSMGYRLLEQTRAGKRDDVYYGILRIFVAQNKKFPDDLVEAFKPIYTDEMFKVFIFSFLSGIIGKEQQTENKN